MLKASGRGTLAVNAMGGILRCYPIPNPNPNPNPNPIPNSIGTLLLLLPFPNAYPAPP